MRIHFVSRALILSLSCRALIPSTGRLMNLMLPLLMMRHRRIPRAKWQDNYNENGKHWIQHVCLRLHDDPDPSLNPILQAPEDMTAEKFRTSMIGYSLHLESSLCGMAMTQGVREKVVTIGLGFKQYAVEPRGASIEAYVESCSHKASITRYDYHSTVLT